MILVIIDVALIVPQVQSQSMFAVYKCKLCTHEIIPGCTEGMLVLNFPQIIHHEEDMCKFLMTKNANPFYLLLNMITVSECFIVHTIIALV